MKRVIFQSSHTDISPDAGQHFSACAFHGKHSLAYHVAQTCVFYGVLLFAWS